MTMITLGLAADEAEAGIGANCLWPRTIIATAAVQNLLGGDEAMARSRTPEIMGDAAHAILVRDPREWTGNTFIDDEVLAEAGVTDLDGYSAEGAELSARHLRRRLARGARADACCSPAARAGQARPRPARRRRRAHRGGEHRATTSRSTACTSPPTRTS